MSNKQDFTEKDRYLLYKETYFYGLAETNKVLMRLPMLLAGLTILLNVYFKILELDDFKLLPPLIQNTIFILICTFIATTIVFCILTAKRKNYSYLDIENIEFDFIKNKIPEYFEKNKDLNKDLPIPWQNNSPKSENEMILDYFLDTLPRYIEDNNKVNEDRKRWFSYALYSIFFNIGFVLVLIISVKYNIFTTLIFPILIFFSTKYGIFNMYNIKKENVEND